MSGYLNLTRFSNWSNGNFTQMPSLIIDHCKNATTSAIGKCWEYAETPGSLGIKGTQCLAKAAKSVLKPEIANFHFNNFQVVQQIKTGSVILGVGNTLVTVLPPLAALYTSYRLFKDVVFGPGIQPAARLEPPLVADEDALAPIAPAPAPQARGFSKKTKLFAATVAAGLLAFTVFESIKIKNLYSCLDSTLTENIASKLANGNELGQVTYLQRMGFANYLLNKDSEAFSKCFG
ncbi:MAG: hypothetical protein JXA94_03125 [Parachlamydiales bacterium]|nr:hypothetical protein [Parachlamydiales bacterium]